MDQGTLIARLQDAIAWRVRRLLGNHRADRALVKMSHAWRPFLKNSIFIGVAGSAGKTTAKELLLGILSTKGQTVGNPESYNMLPGVAETILRTRRTHKYCVSELSEDRPGAMDPLLDLLQPSIGIVTVVGCDHLAAFQSQDDIAAEIGKLVAALPVTGTAVLNADDPIVLSMTAHSVAKVVTFGISEGADLRAEDVSSAWPARLEMTVVHGAERARVFTQLCGMHWVPSVLGAIGGGMATGMSLAECAQGLASVAPFDGRMQPVTTPDGVTFIRDDFKSPLWTIDACFAFMKSALAARKIIVIGELQEVGTQKGKKYSRTASLAQEIAEITIFVGPWASSALKARQLDGGNALFAFSHLRDAAEYLNSIMRPGDLVLLKGANKQDHLQRIVLARTEAIACWRDDCGKDLSCSVCPSKKETSGEVLLPTLGNNLKAADLIPVAGNNFLEVNEQVIVGLGNPEKEHFDTPHNVGYEVVNRLAADLGLTWTKTPAALVARGTVDGRSICLIKVQKPMNLTGLGLSQLAESLPFTVAQCILVFDDLEQRLGEVRMRLHGGSGGHRGVASIFDAFQNGAFRRVKVGVGKPAQNGDRAEYVLTPFDPASSIIIDQAIGIAAERVLKMVAEHPK